LNKGGLKQAQSIIKVLFQAANVSFIRRSMLATDILEGESRVDTANCTRCNSQLLGIHSKMHLPRKNLQTLVVQNFYYLMNKNLPFNWPEQTWSSGGCSMWWIRTI